MALQMETNVCLLWVICGNPAVGGLGTLQVWIAWGQWRGGECPRMCVGCAGMNRVNG